MTTITGETLAAEARRLQYLKAMGVDSYVSRQVLPGALPSVVYDWPDEPLSDCVSPGVPLAPADKNILSRLQQDLGVSPRKGPVAVRQAAADLPAPNVVPANVIPAHSVLQFQLAIFQPVKTVLILVPAHNVDVAHLQLLKNILLALTVKIDELVPVDNFTWPPRVSGTVKVNPTLESAQETLHALLEGYQLKSGIKNILVFAGGLAEKIFPVEALEHLAMKNLDLVCLPELQQMLEDGQHKKITWQKIRHLVL